MDIRIERLDPHDSDELNRFVRLERKILGKERFHVSDFDADIVDRLAGSSAFFHDSAVALFIAHKGIHPVGRCAAFIMPRYQKSKRENVGFIGYFAAAADQAEAISAMLHDAETWLKLQSVSRVIAPYNGSPFFGYGVMIDGFDEEAKVPFGWNPPWYADYLKSSGYLPRYPLWYYSIDLTSEAFANANRLTTRNHLVKVRPIRKGHWHEDLETIRRLIGLTYTREWAFSELTSEEMQEYFDSKRPYLSRQQVLLAEVEGHTAGFCIGQPCWNAVIRSFEGNIGLRNALKLKHEIHQYDGAGLIMIGVLREYRGIGVARSLAVHLYRHYAQHGQKEAGYYFVNEENTGSRAFAEMIGGSGSAAYMVYDKML